MAGIAYFECMWLICVPLVLVESIDIYETKQTPAIQSSCDLGFDLNNTREGDYFSCCEGLCKCTNTTADCSGHAGILPFVPRLPSTVLFLNLSDNKLRKIQRDFFSNATAVKTLSLRNNDIYFIDPDAFDDMYTLEALDVSNCRLSVPSLDIVFKIPTLHCLDISSNWLGDIPWNATLPQLEDIFLQENSLETLDLQKFMSSPLLRGVFSGHNSIKEVLSAPLPSLERLNLSSNRITMYPPMCSSDGVPLFPKLETLDLSNNLIEASQINVSCGTHLNSLILSGNRIRRFGEDMVSDRHFPRLAFLDMSDQRLANTTLQPVEIKQHAFRQSSLQTLSLKNNTIDFSKETYVSSKGFAALPNLTFLDLSYNKMTEVSEQRFVGSFRDLTNLRYLNIGSTLFNRLSNKTFSHFHYLTVLSLRHNYLTVMPDGAFEDNPNLKVLDLRDNNISALSESTFSETTRSNIQKLLLDGNPVDNQVCDTPWLRDWLKQNITISDRWGYNCSGHEMSVTPIPFIPLSGQAKISQSTSIGIIVFVTIFIVILTIIMLYYKFCMPVPYCWITVQYRQDRYRNQQLALSMEEFDYDIFVCYSSGDSEWVFRDLMPKLEGEQGLRLCIHERDFIPGQNIVDNIDECVQRSRLCMMIFSNNFARSQWCQFELAYCLSNELDKDNSLLIVCLDTRRDRFTPAMDTASDVNGCTVWDKRYQSLFWQRLQRAIANISTGNLLSDLVQLRQQNTSVYARQPRPQQECVLADVNEIITYTASTAPEDSPLLDGSSSSNEDEEKQRQSTTKKHDSKQTRESRWKPAQSLNKDARKKLEQGAAGRSLDDSRSNREQPLRIQRPAPQPAPCREDSRVDEIQDEGDVEKDRFKDDRYGERLNPDVHSHVDVPEDPMVEEETQEELKDQACFINRSILARLGQKHTENLLGASNPSAKIPSSWASHRPATETDADQLVMPECIVNLAFDFDDMGNSDDKTDDDEASTPTHDQSHLNEPEPAAEKGSNLAEDGDDDSTSFQGNVESGPNPIFSPQWQFFENFSHDGGVLQGENSDVYLTVPQKAIPESASEKLQYETVNSSKTVQNSPESKAAEEFKQTENSIPGIFVNDDTTLVDSKNDGTSKPEANVDASSEGAIRIQGAVCTDLIRVSRTFDLQDEKIFSPVVEYYAGENYLFQRPVSIYLPHFLPPDHRVEDVRVYTFHRRETGDISLQALILLEPNSAEEIPIESEYYEAKFAQLDDESKSVGAFYFTGESGIVVLTNHFSGVFCSQCGKENERSLHLFLTMYGTQMMPRTQYNYLKLVIWDKRLRIQDFVKNCPMSSEEQGMILKDSESMGPLPPEHTKDVKFGARLDLPEDEAGVWSHVTCRGRIMQRPEIRISLENLVYCCDEGQQPELVRWTLVRKDDKNINNFVCFLTVGYVTAASGGTTMEFISNPEEKLLQVKSPELQSGCSCHSLPGAGVSEIPGNGHAMSYGLSSVPDLHGLYHQSFHQAGGRQPEPQNHQGYLYQSDYQGLPPQYHHSRHYSPPHAASNGYGSPSSMFAHQNRPFTPINPLADVHFPPTQGNVAMQNHKYHFPGQTNGQVFNGPSFQHSIPPGQHRDVYSDPYPGNAIPCHNPESGVNPGSNYVPGFVAPTHGNGSAAVPQNGSPAFASGPHCVHGHGQPQTVSSAEPAGGDFVSGLNNSFSNSPSMTTNTSLNGYESICGGPSRPSLLLNKPHNRPTPTTVASERVAQLPSHREPTGHDPSKLTRTPANSACEHLQISADSGNNYDQDEDHEQRDRSAFASASGYSTEESSETLTNTDSTELEASHPHCLLPKPSRNMECSSTLNAQADLLAMENGSCANGQIDSAIQAATGAGPCGLQADGLDVSNSRNSAVCSELLQNFQFPMRCTSAEPTQVLQIQNLTLVRHEYHAPITNNNDHSSKSDNSTHTIDKSQKTTTTVDKSNHSVNKKFDVKSETIENMGFENTTTTHKPTYNKVSTGRRRRMETSEDYHPQNEEYGDPQLDTSNDPWSHENSRGSSLCPPTGVS